MKSHAKFRQPMKGRLKHGNSQLHHGHSRDDLDNQRFHLVGAKDQTDLLDLSGSYEHMIDDQYQREQCHEAIEKPYGSQ
jgi:hypothetical protein